MQQEKDKLRKTLKQTKKALDDLENPQPVQIIKDAKVCSGDRTKGMAGHSSAKEIRSVAHVYSQATEQKSGIEAESYRKDLWENLLSHGVDLLTHMGQPWFLRMLYHQNHFQPGMKGTEMR